MKSTKLESKLKTASNLLQAGCMETLAQVWERIRRQAMRELVVERLNRVLGHVEERKAA